MSDVIDFNARRLTKEIDKLAKDKDIIKFAQWINEHVTDDFLKEDLDNGELTNAPNS